MLRDLWCRLVHSQRKVVELKPRVGEARDYPTGYMKCEQCGRRWWAGLVSSYYKKEPA